jgi:hypothetical protein
VDFAGAGIEDVNAFDFDADVPVVLDQGFVLPP